MVKKSAIRFSDLKRTVVAMRCDGMSEAEVIQEVLYCMYDYSPEE